MSGQFRCHQLCVPHAFFCAETVLTGLSKNFSWTWLLKCRFDVSGGAAEQYGEGNKEMRSLWLGITHFLVLEVALKADVF